MGAWGSAEASQLALGFDSGHFPDCRVSGGFFTGKRRSFVKIVRARKES